MSYSRGLRSMHLVSDSLTSTVFISRQHAKKTNAEPIATSNNFMS